MPLMISRLLATADWRRSLDFHRAVGFQCRDPNDGEANALQIIQRNGWWDTTRITAVPAEVTPSAATVHLLFADRAHADALFERAIAAGARVTGPLQYEDLDGHTWVLEHWEPSQACASIPAADW